MVVGEVATGVDLLVIGGGPGGYAAALRAAAAGRTVATGTARFATARRVAVTRGDDAAFFEFTSLVLATGSRPVDLVSLPFDGRTVLDSTAALALRRVPGRITVVGGGYIGVELGGAFAKLGADVTIVELADQLLPGMPTGLARVLERALRARGVTIRLGSKVLGRDGDDLVVEGPTGEARLPVDANGSRDDGGDGEGLVIVAIGRRPNTDALGLAQAGVALDA